jgi:hypothetical protein
LFCCCYFEYYCQNKIINTKKYYNLAQNDTNEDEELTSKCCTDLSVNFNLVNELSKLLIINHTIEKLASNESTESALFEVLDEKYFKFTLEVLKQLTSKNKLLMIDIHLERLINFCIERMYELSKKKFLNFQ